MELPEHMPKQLYFPSQLTVARREAYPERKNAIASLTRAAPRVSERARAEGSVDLEVALAH